MMERRRALMAAKKGGGGLPAEYQEVEWIQSFGTQHIDTGIYPSPTDVHHIKAYNTASLAASCGIRTVKTTDATYNNSKLVFSFRAAGAASGYGGAMGAATTYYFAVPVDEYPHSIDIDIQNNTITLDGITTASLTGTDFQAQSLVPLHLFASYATTKYVGSSMRIYDYSVIRNGQSLMHLIPCYRKTDSVIGMYDTVGQRFLTNVGTGEFTKGADVT